MAGGKPHEALYNSAILNPVDEATAHRLSANAIAHEIVERKREGTLDVEETNILKRIDELTERAAKKLLYHLVHKHDA